MRKVTDIMIYVALAEEFHYVIETFSIAFTSTESDTSPIIYYSGEVLDKIDNRVYSIVLVPAGTMGNTNAGSFVSSLIDEFNPLNIVVLGIAGALSKDLSPGDIFVPTRVVEYMANSASIGSEKIDFQTSGNHYDCDKRLVNRLQNLQVTKSNSYKNWQSQTGTHFSQNISDSTLKSLIERGININSYAKLMAGDDRSLASGPTVGKGSAFATWLKTQVDRKLAAMEMESAGVFAAAFTKINRPRLLAIRAISDIASEKKNILEEIAGDALRLTSMKNAITLLQTAIEQGVFAPEKKKTLKSIIKKVPLIKKVFVIGGEPNESPTDEEVEDLQKSCGTIGSELAKAGIELIVCSPFKDSADYYTASGYAEAAKNGTIHFHFPGHKDVFERKTQFEQHLARHCKSKCPKIVNWQHPTYPNIEARKQAWLLCQLQALEQADAIVSVGGRISNSASTLLHLAEIKKLPIVPYTFLDGASKMLFDRVNWQELHPKVITKYLEDITGPKKVVELLRQLVLDNTEKENSLLSNATKVFISRARKDAGIANEIGNFLHSTHLTALFGDEAIKPQRAIIPAIEEYIGISSVFIVLWSANYALSPWCHDELMYAINKQQSKTLTILIFNIDNTPIIPTEARKLTCISAKTSKEIIGALVELLNLGTLHRLDLLTV